MLLRHGYASHRDVASPGRAFESSVGSNHVADIVAGAKLLAALMRQKKEPPLPAAQGDNREASNRVDRSHSMSRRWTIIVMNEKA
jgi:hypothetical protein